MEMLKEFNGAVVCLSGGCDSLTLLTLIKRQMRPNAKVHAVSFDYGQRHKKELSYASRIAKHLDVPHYIYNVDLTTFGRSPLVDSNIKVPEQSENKQETTVVPFRNTMFLVFATAHATIHELDVVAIGAVREDLRSYPDCRPEYFYAIERALRLADCHHTLKILTPFVTLRKDEIVRLGVNELGIDYSMTWTCYEGGEIHCGRCDACVERKMSFELAGITDPTVYLR